MLNEFGTFWMCIKIIINKYINVALILNVVGFFFRIGFN